MHARDVFAERFALPATPNGDAPLAPAFQPSTEPAQEVESDPGGFAARFGATLAMCSGGDVEASSAPEEIGQPTTVTTPLFRAEIVEGSRFSSPPREPDADSTAKAWPFPSQTPVEVDDAPWSFTPHVEIQEEIADEIPKQTSRAWPFGFQPALSETFDAAETGKDSPPEIPHFVRAPETLSNEEIDVNTQVPDPFAARFSNLIEHVRAPSPEPEPVLEAALPAHASPLGKRAADALAVEEDTLPQASPPQRSAQELEAYFAGLRAAAKARKAEADRLKRRRVHEATRSAHAAPKSVRRVVTQADYVLEVEELSAELQPFARRDPLADGVADAVEIPTDADYAIVHNDAYAAIRAWLDAHRARAGSLQRGLLVDGPSGSGKTVLARRALSDAGYDICEFSALDARSPRDIETTVTEAARRVVHADAYADARPLALLFTETETLSNVQRASINALKALLAPWRFGARKRQHVPKRWLAPMLFLCERRDARCLHGLAAACNLVRVPSFPAKAMLTLAKETLPARGDEELQSLVELARGDVRALQTLLAHSAGVAPDTNLAQHCQRIGLCDAFSSVEQLYATLRAAPTLEHAVQLSFAAISKAPQLVQEHYLDACESLEAAAAAAENIAWSDLYERATDLNFKPNPELREELAVYALLAPTVHTQHADAVQKELRAPALGGRMDVVRNAGRKLQTIRDALLEGGANAWESASLGEYRVCLAQLARHSRATSEKLARHSRATSEKLAMLGLTEIELKLLLARIGERPPSDAEARRLRVELDRVRARI